MRRQRHVVGLQRQSVREHFAAERGVHESLDLGHAAIACHELEHTPAALGQLPADLPVRADISAAEPVDRLFRIADDEQLAKDRTRMNAFADGRIVRRKEQQNLGLNRIGVLKLVDKDAPVLRLQMAAHFVVRLDHLARLHEEVGEVECPGCSLERLIPLGRARQFLLQVRGKVGVGVLSESLQLGEQRVAGGEHVRSRDALSELVAAALACPQEAAITREIDQARLPAIDIALTERFLQLDLPAQSADAGGVDEQAVALGEGRVRHIGQMVERGDEPTDLHRSIERRSPPRTREIAPLGEGTTRLPQPIDGPVALALALESGRARPPEGATQAVEWVLKGFLQPRAKGATVQAIGLQLGQHGEQRIDPRFDRPLAQQLGAEAVDGVDVRLFERFERVLETPPRVSVGCRRAFELERLAQSELQFPCGFFGERNGDDLDHRRAPGRQHAQDAADQLGCLAGPGRRFDDERVIEGLDDGATGIGVSVSEWNQRVHRSRGPTPARLRCGARRLALLARAAGAVHRSRAPPPLARAAALGACGRYRIARSASRSAKRSGAFRLTRSSSRGPHTGRKSHHAHARSAGAAARNPVSTARSMMVSACKPCPRV